MSTPEKVGDKTQGDPPVQKVGGNGHSYAHGSIWGEVDMSYDV